MKGEKKLTSMGFADTSCPCLCIISGWLENKVRASLKSSAVLDADGAFGPGTSANIIIVVLLPCGVLYRHIWPERRAIPSSSRLTRRLRL
jgi:hypothetical protein